MSFLFLLNFAMSIIIYLLISRYVVKIKNNADGLMADVNNCFDVTKKPVTKKTIDGLLSLANSRYDNKENKMATMFAFLSFLFFFDATVSMSYFFQYFVNTISHVDKKPEILSETTIFMAFLPAAISINFLLLIDRNREKLLNTPYLLSPAEAEIPFHKLQAIKNNNISFKYLIGVVKLKRELTVIELDIVCKHALNENSAENKALFESLNNELFFRKEEVKNEGIV